MALDEIANRYSDLANQDCCLSCGGAINYTDIKEGEVCIDLGSGRGTDVLRMALRVGKNGFVYGVDVSDGMLEKARKEVKKFDVSNVDFLKTDLEKINLDDNIADLVISNCTINHADNKDAVWREVYRLLKSGGRFVVSDIYSIEDVPEEYKNDPVAVAECWAGAVRKDVYLDTLNKTGFKNIKIIEESKPYEKGKISVASFTVFGMKTSCKCCSS